METWKNVFWVLLSVQAIGVDPVFGEDFPMVRLLEDLMKNYSRYVRPVRSQHTVMTAYVNLTNVKSIAVSEKEQFFSIHMSYTMQWTDEQLTWDPESYGGVHKMHIPAADIWVPDIIIGEQNPQQKSLSSLYAETNSSGFLMMAFSLKTNCSCFFNIYYFPFDKHNCSVTFLAWVHSANELEVRMLESKEVFEGRWNRNIEFGGEWKMTGLQTFHVIREIRGIKYDEQTFYFLFHRIPMYYIAKMIAPSVLLILTDFLSFILPLTGNERTTMKVNILLGYTFNLIVVIEILPATAVSPLVGIYLTACSLILSTSIVATIFLIRMSHIPKSKKTPWKSHGIWLKVKKSIEFITKSRSIELTTLNVAAETRITKAANKKLDKRKAEDLDCGFFFLYSVTIVLVGLTLAILWARVEIVPV
uniref:5-hydroxytryptamine receptor 3A-like isoform X2 n=1 Tax=Myxine glutinosa TaxID=7769 RepID=UPI00358E0A26